MNTLEGLMVRYQYQFSNPTISLELAQGWFALFAQLCEDVDQVLGEDKHDFRWLQVKEKFGMARFYYRLGTAPDEEDEGNVRNQFGGQAELMQKLHELRTKTEEASAKTCAACGAPGFIRSRSGYLLALCADHHRRRAAGERFSVWVEK